MAKLYTKRIPNIVNLSARILVIGEAPGSAEELFGEPFSGDGGKLLMDTFGAYGVTRSQLSLVNLCQYRPYDNNYEQLEGSAELKHGKDEVQDIIRASHSANIIFGLGEKVLNYLTGKQSIHRYRGSILSEPLSGKKIVCSFNPALITRNHSAIPVLSIDTKRVVEESQYPDIRRIKRDFHMRPSVFDYEQWATLLCSKAELGVDIESAWNTEDKRYHILSISFSPTPHESYVFPYTFATRNWIQLILASPAKKIFHFGTYDTLVLADNGLLVNEFAFDTHIAAHIIEPEFRRTLDFLTSVYTKEPYYKQEGRADLPSDTKAWGARTDKDSIYIYNAKDTAVTIEIKQKQEEFLRKRKLYDFFLQEMEMLEVAFHISRTGMLVDVERRELMRKALLFRWKKEQFILAGLTGGIVVNVASYIQVPKLLYNTLGLPERRNDGKLVADEDAIVSLIGFCAGKINEMKTDDGKLRWRVKMTICRLILSIRQIRKMLTSYVAAPLSTDNRYRSVYNVGATETGRWSASAYVDETGVNSQTFSRGFIEIPDEILNESGGNDELEGMMATLLSEEKGENE
jgi:uracil-DNA glycosylase family 4